MIKTPITGQNGNVQLKVWWRHWSVVFILAVLAGLVIWSMLNLGPWLRTWQEQRAAAAAQKQLERAYREDKYGGKTPEETLKLFIKALKKEDVALAGKYFLLDENGSREKWENSLRRIKNNNRINEVVKIIEEKLKVADKEITHEGDFKFYIVDEEEIKGLVDMELNKYSGIWKIESF